MAETSEEWESGKPTSTGMSNPVLKLNHKIHRISMSPSLTQAPPEVWFADYSKDYHNLLGWLSQGDTQYDE